ncbi:MAG: DMT family transporter [Weeksellaceae bacterium]|nr:DMT family transporter [Weeksellaceae bacterium]
MLGFLIIFIGHFSYGITNVLWKNPRDIVGTFPLIAMRSFGCMLIFSAIFLISNFYGITKFPAISLMKFLQIFGLCAVNSLGLVFYVTSLKYGDANKVIGFSKLNVVIWILISVFIFREEISTKKIILALLITLGIYLIDSSKKMQKVKPSKALLFTILSRLFWSTAFLFIPYIKEFGILFFCIVLELSVFTVSFTISLFQKDNCEVLQIKGKTRGEILFLIFLGCIGTLSLNFAIAEISIFLFAVLALLEPIVGLIFVRIYYQERLEFRQILGISLSLTSSFILAL